MKKVLFLTILLLKVAYAECIAQGNLLVTPVRIIFDENRTKEDLNVCNIGSDTAVFVISFLHYKMLEDGSFSELQLGDSSVRLADEFLRIFPRRVKLAPNESQTIRLQYRKSAMIKEGEYRSHLYFRADKMANPLGYEEKKDNRTMSISITPIFGISIPVFIRNGQMTKDLKFSDIALQTVNDSVSKLSVVLNRSGNMSIYGNLSVSHTYESGKVTLLTQSDGIGIYQELDKRLYTISIRSKELVNHPDGKLILTFSTPINEGGAEMAKTEFILL